MIDLQVMSEEEIAAQNIEFTELWMVRLGEQIYGPYHTEALKEYAVFHEALFADADVTNMAEENWVMFLQSPLRTVKRKAPPKLVSATTLATHDSYHVERLGHRHGPHSHETITAMVKKGELLPTDLISDDEGFTWHKVYQLKEFEARPHEAQLLPFAPSDESFQRAHDEALRSLMVEENPVKEGLVSLAHYGYRKASSDLDLEDLTAFKITAPHRPIPRQWWMGGAAASAVLALMLWWSSAPAPHEQVATHVTGEENSEKSSSLFDAVTPRVLRRPASTRPARIIPPASRSPFVRRQELSRYQETHDSYDERDIPAPAEPMDVDPYGAESHVVQQDERNENTDGDAAARNPSSAQAPDAAYQDEEPIPGETAPAVEEVSDI